MRAPTPSPSTAEGPPPTPGKRRTSQGTLTGWLALLIGVSLLGGLVAPGWAVAAGALVLGCGIGAYGLGRWWVGARSARLERAAYERTSVSSEEAHAERQLLKAEIRQRQGELDRLHARLSKIPSPYAAPSRTSGEGERWAPRSADEG